MLVAMLARRLPPRFQRRLPAKDTTRRVHQEPGILATASVGDRLQYARVHGSNDTQGPGMRFLKNLQVMVDGSCRGHGLRIAVDVCDCAV